MTLQATGRKDERDPSWVVFTRTFRAPVDDVWASITEPERLERWIGTWEGDPASGQVLFTMTAEGEGAQPVVNEIDECRPPYLLQVSFTEEGQPWVLRLELRESDGVTTLDFAQRITDPELGASVGPGWEYYLDRLVTAQAGGDAGTVQWGDYFPAMSDHYRSLLAT
ncbi:MAG TPA: SRPBCC family protein [Nocardioidaceae bacterium]|nr:SRPBCC family protein [Nocardioidaceae bacterium]